ncbi:MAG TPA: hypothetical protein VFR34_01390, partial [Paracoccaceae bacterium]|nr:hypothetical protein [Paracoccaceae bacterium]
ATAPPPPPPPPPGEEPGSPGAGRLAQAQARAAQVDTVLAALPSPLTAASLIERVIGWTLEQRRNDFIGVTIPIIDDVFQPLQTLAQWSAMTQAQLGTSLRDSLFLLRDRLRAAGPDRLDAALAPVAALEVPLRATELAGFASAYLTAAAAMEVALVAADTATAALRAADLDAAVADFETLRATMAGDFTPLVPGAIRGLGAAPAGTLDALLHLVTQLETVNPGAALAGLAAPETAPPAAALELQAALAPMLDFLEDLAERLDFSAIEGGVAGVAAQAQAIAEAVNAALADVVADIRAAFAEVEAAVAGIGLAALAAEMRAGIADAGAALEGAIGDGFGPLRDALAEAVQALSDAVDALDFGAIEQALADVVAALAGILQEPAIRGAIEEIRAALDQVSAALRQLSFAPVTDEVIKLIEEMTKGLRALSETDLNDALKGALNAALSVLPPDLRPITEPLIDEFGVAIDEGPVVLLERIREKPQEVLDRIREFDPGALVGEALSGPFREATGKLESFRPSALIAPLGAELDAQKARLKAAAKPSVALAPLAEAFDALLAQIDRLEPGALIAPIEEAVEQAIRDAVEASPVDEIFAEINGVFATIQSVLDMAGAMAGTLQRLADALAALADHEAQIDAWRDAILGKLEGLPNAGSVTGAMNQMRAAANATRHADLLAQFDAAAAPLMVALGPLAPGAQLTQMVLAQQRLRPRVRALPAGAERTAIEAALDRFDPLDPAEAGGLRAAAELHQGALAARAALAALEPDFGGILHGPEGALTAITGAATNAAALRGVLEGEVELALGPVRYLMARLAIAAAPVGAVAQSFADLQARLTGALANILTGPASLQTISEAVQGVVDTLRSVDLGFLREAIEGVFRTVREQIEALGPRPLMVELDREFGEVIDALDLGLILPESEIAALDASYETVLNGLKALDPGELVTNVVGPTFEAEIVPLVEALDLTPVFDALIAALRELDEELKSELGRVNTAYQALLAARPGGGAAASVGL